MATAAGNFHYRFQMNCLNESVVSFDSQSKE